MSKLILLTREQFKAAVFARDNYTCVFCDKPAVDAHHIIERRLWGESQGYYIENGASVCEFHHIKCEETTISVEDVRAACKITKIVVPEHLYHDQPYNKWGDPVLPNGQRLKGELFYDESVQKILAQGKVLDLYTNYVKYPRTYHLPWSEGMNDDDRMLKSLDAFLGKRVIATEKRDGENTSCYRDYIHARSIDGRSHSSRDWVKQFWSTFSGDIPEGWRVCGENLYAKHSIHYQDLETYFYGFSIWNDRNECLSWDETMEWFSLMGITPVPILYDGIFDEVIIKKLWDPANWDTQEGYVLRLADKIGYGEFKTKVGKFVRKNHIATAAHNWQTQKVVPNLLKKND